MVIFTRGGNACYFDSEVFIFCAGNLRNVWEVHRRNEYYCYMITDGHNICRHLHKAWFKNSVVILSYIVQ